MRVGIVGSRRRNTLADREIVHGIIKKALWKYGRHALVIVSGGCPQGADAFAKEFALAHGLTYVEFPVPLDPPIKHRGDFRERAYARNRLIAEDSHVIFALVHPDRTGGTENTVAHMLELQKHVFLVDQEGRVYLPQDAPEADKT